MKVLILHSELGILRGGGENFTKNLFAAFAKRGHVVAAAFVANRDGRYPISLPAHITPVPLAGWWSRKFGQAFFSSIGACIPATSRLRTQWDRVQEALCWRTVKWHNQRFQRYVESVFSRRWEEFDVVYVHSNVILASAVARYRPTVLRLPGPVTAELAPVLRSVQAVCANGDALAHIRAFLGDHAFELPIGLDSQIFKPGPTSVRAALGWTAQCLVVGYVGRLAHVKGVDLLAAAFRDIAPTVSEARLLVVGSGEEERKMRSMLSQELAHRIAHIEPDVNHKQLPQWYRAMDLLVMPSRYENFSNTVLEAMACGVPVLASDVGGNKMLAETGTGWLFKPASAAVLSACVRRLMENRSEMQTRAELGAHYVRQRYSWAAGAAHLEAIISSRLGVRG